MEQLTHRLNKQNMPMHRTKKSKLLDCKGQCYSHVHVKVRKTVLVVRQTDRAGRRAGRAGRAGQGKQVGRGRQTDKPESFLTRVLFCFIGYLRCFLSEWICFCSIHVHCRCSRLLLSLLPLSSTT